MISPRAVRGGERGGGPAADGLRPLDRRPVHDPPGFGRHAAPGGYARFEYLQALDVGQDTDFELLGRLCPRAEVNCILFPSWVAAGRRRNWPANCGG